MTAIPRHASGRPNHKRDVDWVFGEYGLKLVQEDPRTSTWETPLFLNIVFGVMALLMLALLVAHLTLHLWSGQPASTGLAHVGIAILLAAAFVAFVMAAWSRCRVVIDLQKGELRSYAGLRLRPRGTLAVRDIESLYLRAVEVFSGTNTDANTQPGHDELLIAQLTDGRIVLLAARAPYAFAERIERLREVGRE